jgi:ribosomal protein S12 methylthiotransferase accessory factor
VTAPSPFPAVPKAFRRGTHRAATPEETFERARRFMPVMGITRVADVTGLDHIGVPVALAYRPNARSLAVSAGKGLDLAAAKASALMEAIEGWHAERILHPLLLASVNELRFTHSLADVARLPRVSAGALHDDLRILWIEGRNLADGAPAWLPFEVVHTNYTLPLPPRSGALLASSNGLASGNHLVEAAAHAVGELVERDATTLWHALDEAGRRRTRVDLATVDDEACASVLSRFAAARVAVGVWEITSDVGVAAFRCTIVDEDPTGHRSHLPGLGSGCHPSRGVALLRALTEAAQTRLTLITGARDDLGLAHYVAAQDRAVHARVLAEMRAGPACRSFAAAPTRESDTLDEDLAHLLARLHAAGAPQAILVDLTRPGIGIPVARVVVPGLEGLHDAPGYVPGPRCRRALEARTP